MSMMVEYNTDYGECPRLTNFTADLAGNFTVWAASPEASFLKSKFVWVNWDVDELKELSGTIRNTALFTLGLNDYSNFQFTSSAKVLLQ
jgi:hypothetical protein